jgi:hypothetical protein
LSRKRSPKTRFGGFVPRLPPLCTALSILEQVPETLGFRLETHFYRRYPYPLPSFVPPRTAP